MPGALVEFRASFEIRERLAEQDPDNAEWQTDVAVSCWKLADCTERPESIELLEQGLTILRQLDERGRLVPYWQEWIPRYDGPVPRATMRASTPGNVNWSSSRSMDDYGWLHSKLAASSTLPPPR